MVRKPIDINQRIPLSTLHIALDSYLKDEYSEEYILEQLRFDFGGENRLKKALRLVSKVVTRNPLDDFLKEHAKLIRTAMKRKDDRNVILITLLNSSLPFSFDLLRIFGKYLSVQEIINRETIRKALSDTYGGNRSTINAIDSVVPMLLEAGFIERPQSGVYQRNIVLKVVSDITRKIYIESFRVNSRLDSVQDYQLRDPYFLFMDDF